MSAKCIEFDLPIEPWSHNKVARMLCSPVLSSSIKNVLSPEFSQLTLQVLSYPQGHIYQVIFLIAFHGFFRISNLLQQNKQELNPPCYLTRDDVISTPQGLSIIIKWTNTLQNSYNTQLIPGSPRSHSRLSSVSPPGSA